jgi:hypothetical protein
MKKLVIAAALGVASCTASAAPFLLSDPWAAGTLQPDTCSYTEAPSTLPHPLALLTDTNGLKYIKQDMAGIPSGSHTITVVCTNAAWGLASTPVNFTFSASAPASPAGLRLVP